MASSGVGIYSGVGGPIGGYLRRKYSISRASFKRKMFSLDVKVFERVIRVYLNALGKKILHEAKWNL